MNDESHKLCSNKDRCDDIIIDTNSSVEAEQIDDKDKILNVYEVEDIYSNDRNSSDLVTVGTSSADSKTVLLDKESKTENVLDIEKLGNVAVKAFNSNKDEFVKIKIPETKNVCDYFDIDASSSQIKTEQRVDIKKIVDIPEVEKMFNISSCKVLKLDEAEKVYELLDNEKASDFIAMDTSPSPDMKTEQDEDSKSKPEQRNENIKSNTVNLLEVEKMDNAGSCNLNLDKDELCNKPPIKKHTSDILAINTSSLEIEQQRNEDSRSKTADVIKMEEAMNSDFFTIDTSPSPEIKQDEGSGSNNMSIDIDNMSSAATCKSNLDEEDAFNKLSINKITSDFFPLDASSSSKIKIEQDEACRNKAVNVPDIKTIDCMLSCEALKSNKDKLPNSENTCDFFTLDTSPSPEIKTEQQIESNRVKTEVIPDVQMIDNATLCKTLNLEEDKDIHGKLTANRNKDNIFAVYTSPSPDYKTDQQADDEDCKSKTLDVPDAEKSTIISCKALSVDKVEKICRLCTNENTCDTFTSLSQEYKTEQQDEGRSKTVAVKSDIEKIGNLASYSSCKDFDEVDENKYHVLEKGNKISNNKIVRASKKKIPSASFKRDSPVVIDINDDCEEGELLDIKADIKQSEKRLLANKIKLDDSSCHLNDFMIIDTQLIPDVIDIDQPFKYKKLSKVGEIDRIPTYQIFGGRYKRGSFAKRKRKSIHDSYTSKNFNATPKLMPVIDIDDDDDQPAQNDHKSLKCTEKLNSSQVPTSSSASRKCSIEHSSSIKCENINNCSSNDKKYRNYLKENKNTTNHISGKDCEIHENITARDLDMQKTDTKISYAASQMITVIDDESDQAGHIGHKNDSENMVDQQSGDGSSSTNDTSLLAISCSIANSSDITYETDSCISSDEKHTNDMKGNKNIESPASERNVETHKSKRRKLMKHSSKNKESPISYDTVNTYNEEHNSEDGDDDDDVIFEATVCRSFLSLDPKNDSISFQNRLSESSVINQKQKCSTTIEAHANRRKRQKRIRKRRIGHLTSNSANLKFSYNKIAPTFKDMIRNKCIADIPNSTSGLNLYSSNQEGACAKTDNEISFISLKSEVNDKSEAFDSHSSNSYSSVSNRYHDLSFNDNKISPSYADIVKKPVDSMSSDINTIKTEVSNSSTLFDEISLPSNTQQNTTGNNSSDDEVSNDFKETDKLSNDSSQSYSMLKKTSENSEAPCMDIASESDDDVIACVENTDYVPYKTIKLEFEMYPSISDDILFKRRELETLRKWELTRLGYDMVHRLKQVKGTIFTFLSYNVLSQHFLQNKNHLYEKCNSEYLDWPYRWSLFQHEVKHLQPDILALQEVDESLYQTHFLPWFKHLEYNSIFKKKTSDKVDGCAIIYDAKKFKLIEENSVEFYQPSGMEVLNRDNVGLIVKLTPISFSSPFCVATTHILFNPKRTDAKLVQMAVFLSELDRICYIAEENGRPKYCPIILTGDFSSDPYSPLVKFVKQSIWKYRIQKIKNSDRLLDTELIPSSLGLSEYCQHKVLENSRYLEKLRGELYSLKDKRKIEEELIKLSHSDRKPKVKNECLPTVSSVDVGSTSGFLHHTFNFKSVYYHKLDRLNGIPEVTSYQSYWTTADYIFYTRIMKDTDCVEGPLKLIGRYGLLGESEAEELGPLPSDICPSDHFPLAVQFLLKDTTHLLNDATQGNTKDKK